MKSFRYEEFKSHDVSWKCQNFLDSRVNVDNYFGTEWYARLRWHGYGATIVSRQ